MYVNLTAKFCVDMSECLMVPVCSHRIIKDGVQREMRGKEIYKYCFINNIDVPEHFKQYEGCIKKVMLLYNWEK